MNKIAMPALIAALLASAGAQPAPAAGAWNSRTMAVVEQSAGCLRVDVTTATVNLQPGINFQLDGDYALQTLSAWLLNMSGTCVLPGRHASALFSMRFQNWRLSTRDGDAPDRLDGVYVGCTADCEDEPAQPHRITLRLDGPPDPRTLRLTELPPGAPTAVFVDARERELAELGAAQAFFPLLLPLLQGRCNEFAARSLLAAARTPLSQEAYCALYRGMLKNLPAALRDEPRYAFALSLGVLKGLTRAHLLTEGDVFVQRFIVVEGGEGIVLSGLLRRDPTGDWKLLDLTR